VPDVAYFCQRCGTDLYPKEKDSRRRFAAKPDEPLASFAIVSSIMPAGAGRHPQTYRIAFVIAIGAALVASLFGALPIAVLIAAFAVPVVYLTYLYDVNQWKDAPIPVVGIAFLVTGVLAAGFTWVWKGWLPMQSGLSGDFSPSFIAILLYAVLVPVVGELIRQLGPVLLASRPKFDDLMDGVTFGIVAGLAYAAGDTIVRQWALLTGGMASIDPAQWAPLILLEGLVKPLLMGTATGLAVAEFSGLGKKYDGFTPRYYVGVGVAVGANVLYGLGVYLLSFITPSTLAVCLQLVYGALIVGVLLLRLRRVLQLGLMEGALEAAARSQYPEGGANADLDFCPKCEMPLLGSAAHCSACGTQVETKEPVAVSVAVEESTPGDIETPLPVADEGEQL
jgi:hypothetical protein